MQRRFLLLLMTIVIFIFAGLRLCEQNETWLRIEQNGLCFEPEYLHRIVEKDRAELRKYLGGYISFVLPLYAIVDIAETDSFGEIRKLMIFMLENGKFFIVDCSSIDVSTYKTGDMLYVKGKLTAIIRTRSTGRIFATDFISFFAGLSPFKSRQHSSINAYAFKNGFGLYPSGYGDGIYILNAYGCPGWPNDFILRTLL